MMTEGFILWLTGLSGAGKSTLARLAAAELTRRGHRVEVLDGDEVRTNLCRGLGFSKEDRDVNVRRVGYVAGLLSRNGVVAISAVISPYRDVRDDLRRQHQRFFEVYVRCPLGKLVERDVKGLYHRALAGEIPHFTGISDPYEEPLSPELILETSRETAAESFSKLIRQLEESGYIGSNGKK